MTLMDAPNNWWLSSYICISLLVSLNYLLKKAKSIEDLKKIVSENLFVVCLSFWIVTGSGAEKSVKAI